MKKLVRIPLFYYKLFRFAMTLIIFQLLSTAAIGLEIGVQGVSKDISTYAFIGVFILILLDLYYSARYLLQLKEMGENMIAELHKP